MERGCDCMYFCNDNPGIRSFAESRGFGFVPVPEVKLPDEQKWMQEELISYDAVLIDSYNVSSEYISSLNRPAFTVACYDDNALYKYNCDMLINGNLHASGLEFKFGNKKPITLLGGEYTPLRREFYKQHEPPKIRKEANRVLICLGGADIRSFTPTVVAAICEIPNIELTIVLGAMTTCDAAVKTAAAQAAIPNKNIKIIKAPPSIAEVVRSCDIAITSAGSMVYELAALGIPSIIIVQADNQKQIANHLDKNGLMRYIGDWNKTDSKQIRHETENLLGDAQRRKRESKALKQAVSRNGAENVAKKLLETIVRKKGNGDS